MNLAIIPTIIGGESIQTVNARELHKSLELKKDFTSWMKQQIKRADLVENRDYVVSLLKVVNPQGGRPSDEYHVTIEAGKNIAMLSESSKGKEVRAYFIECERRAKAPAMQIKSPVMQMIVAQAIAFDRMEQEQQRQSNEIARIQETVAVIEARTQPENKHFTVLGYANLIKKPVDIKTASKLGRQCAELSREQGMVIGDVSDPRFGRVHSYHESILQAVMSTL